MIFNKQWLDELVPSSLSAEEVSDIITMAGLEVDSQDSVAGEFTGVVVGEVLTCADHPDSDHLHVTTVRTGENEVLDIVCGAPNCRQGLKVACAKVGAVLPGNFRIKPAKLRGVPSNGMLCSAKELGLSDESNGIIEFPADAPVGTDIHDYLRLNDTAITVDLTANRADCLSIRGIAREFGVLTGADVKYPDIPAVPAAIPDVFPVKVADTAGCPRYLTRVIRNVDLSRRSPLWMQERLRRLGMRSLDPVVDVTNYVMLELGQPLHAFDLDALKDEITVRKAFPDEKMVLLSGQEASLTPDTLVIADAAGAVALAGIFGGDRAGVKAGTVNILLESAFFSPRAIKNRARSYGLDTEAAHRFERGVDYRIQAEAMERATRFILDIAGGEAGPVCEAVSSGDLPEPKRIEMPFSLIRDVLGVDVERSAVTDYLSRLGMQPEVKGDMLTAVSPSWRYDIAIPVDICEEVARMYGYDRIPNTDPVAPLRMIPRREARVSVWDIKSLAADLGYHEVVTYSFVDDKSLKALNPEETPIILPHPITSEMHAMRTTLWAGLVNTALYNMNRQISDLRIFETGLTFISDAASENGIRQEEMIGGLITGSIAPESWYEKPRACDFYDIKGDVERLLEITAGNAEFDFVPGAHPALHPGVSARILRNGEYVGDLGLIHPLAQKALGLKKKVFLFQLKMRALTTRNITAYADFSKFPSIRRDFAIVIDSGVPAVKILNTVKKNAGDLLQDISIFDIYEGENIAAGKKSLAFSVVLQAQDRTLEDAAIQEISDRIVGSLRETYGAELRE